MTHFHNWGKTKFLFIPSRQFKRDDNAEMLIKKREIEQMQKEGLSPAEIARELGITPSTLNQRKRRKSL